MKKLLFIVISIVFYAASAYSDNQDRFIVFFAESQDIPQNVLNAINRSKQFCINVPVSFSREAPESIQELISSGKIEPSFNFNPEPVFPALLSVYNKGNDRSEKMDMFKDFIDNNIKTFERNIHKTRFGLFLHSGIVSDSVMNIFNKENLLWINISNSASPMFGIYNIDGLPSFFIYKNFPNNINDAKKWIDARRGKVIPVLLEKQHLQNPSFMSSLINFLDNNNDIKTASPLYITLLRKDLIRPVEKINYTQIDVDSRIMNNLSEAVSVVQRYRKSPNYSEPLYRNAQDEIMFIFTQDFLLSLDEESLNAAYANIFRLLNGTIPINIMETPINAPPPILDEDTERAMAIENGIRIESKGDSIKAINITVSNDRLNVDIDFNKGIWDRNISYIEIYIDINRIDNMGLTSTLNEKSALTPSAAWEYAMKITRNEVELYKASAQKPVLIAHFPIKDGKVSIPKSYINGNPRNWGIQAMAIQKTSKETTLVDYLGTNVDEKKRVLKARMVVFPAIRIRR
jgi:hypothetical protein